MAITPLTSGSLYEASNYITQLKNRLTVKLHSDYKEQVAELDERYSGRLATIDSSSQKWARTLVDGKIARDNVEDNLESADKIRDHLLELRTVLAEIERNPDDLEFRQGQWNDLLVKIEGVATSKPRAFNLIGPASETDFTAGTVEVKTGLGAGTLTMEGAYLGVGFKITEPDGRIWYAEPATQTMIGSATDTEEKQTVSQITGVEKVAYDSGTGAVEFRLDYQENPAGPTTTGTLETGGIDLMGSWFYDLSDQATRDELREKLSAAESQVVIAKSKLTNHKAALDIIVNRANAKIAEFGEQTNGVRVEQAVEQLTLEGEARQKYEAMNTSFDVMIGNQSSAQDLLRNAVRKDGLLGVVLDEKV